MRRLFREPGGLAKDFIAGRRASVAHPVRTFFLSSLVLFTVIALIPRDRVGLVFAFVAAIPAGVGGDWAPWIVLLVTVPLMALVLRVLFIGKPDRYLEHLVATLEFFSVTFLVAALESGLAAASGGWGPVRFGLVAIYSPYLLVYGALLLRRVYGLSLLGATLRMLVLALCYFLGVGYFIAGIGRAAASTAS